MACRRGALVAVGGATFAAAFVAWRNCQRAARARAEVARQEAIENTLKSVQQCRKVMEWKLEEGLGHVHFVIARLSIAVGRLEEGHVLAPNSEEVNMALLSELRGIVKDVVPALIALSPGRGGDVCREVGPRLDAVAERLARAAGEDWEPITPQLEEMVVQALDEHGTAELKEMEAEVAKPKADFRRVIESLDVLRPRWPRCSKIEGNRARLDAVLDTVKNGMLEVYHDSVGASSNCRPQDHHLREENLERIAKLCRRIDAAAAEGYGIMLGIEAELPQIRKDTEEYHRKKRANDREFFAEKAKEAYASIWK